LMHSIRVFPNPAKGQIQVFVQLQEWEPLTITMRDWSGLIRYNTKVSGIQNGEYHLTIDVSRYQPGIYFLQAQSERNSVVKKIMVVK
jgi:Secretion system C-terminal sorting domain